MTQVKKFQFCRVIPYCLILLFPGTAVVAASGKPGYQEVAFDTDEGTWMSVDISPTGETILFDLLGDIYIMPAKGGTARNILTGRSYDHMPRWSPDGRQIAFISDRSGSDNAWVMDSDGSNLRRVSDDETWGVFSPAWSPDAARLVVSRRIGDAYELWSYPVSGKEGQQLTNGQEVKNPQGPVFSSDGRYIYFSSGTRTLEPTFEVWQIYRLDLQTKDVMQVTTRYGSSVRPEISADGRYMAFARTLNGRDGLWLRDLHLNIEHYCSTASLTVFNPGRLTSICIRALHLHLTITC